ncbi:MAG TPA: Yip1 family protein [Caulobacterales bacterium]|nr:Yip1 family protein [Caulobacterales bacterium]
MSMDVSGAGAPSLIDRAKNIITAPRAEWAKIAGEKADVGKLYMGYLLPLAAAAAIAMAIGWTVFGMGGFGFTVRLPIAAVISMAVTQLLGALIGVYVFALILNALAPSFGSQADMGQAHKLAVYSSTAGYLAGLFQIFPPLGVLGLLGLYSLVLLYLGMPVLMKTPNDKRVGYFISAIVVAIVLGIVFGVALGAVRTMFGGVGGFAGIGGSVPAPSAQGEVKLPNGATVNLSEMEKLAKQMEAAQSGDAKGAAAIDPAKLQALLPQALPGGFVRDSVESSTASAMGAASAEGVYKNGDKTIRLTIASLGPMGAMAGLAAAAGVNANREDANGYERARTVDGRMITEQLDKAGNTAKYAVIGKKGAALTAEGSGGVSVDEARAAVEAVGIERAEALGG